MGARIARHPERISERRPGFGPGRRAVHAGRAPLRPALVRRSKKLTQQSEKALRRRGGPGVREGPGGAPEGPRERAGARRAPLRRRPEGGRHEGARAGRGRRPRHGRGGTLLPRHRRVPAGAGRVPLMPATDAAFDRDASSLRHAAAAPWSAPPTRPWMRSSARGVSRSRGGPRDGGGVPGPRHELREAHAQALHRIAILPVSNQTEAAGLARELTTWSTGRWRAASASATSPSP